MEGSFDVAEEKMERVVKCRIESCSNIIHTSYYKKYRLCAEHAKASEILHRGTLVRFCQKCSRLHRIEAFEGNRRSCKHTLESNRIRRRERYHAKKGDRGRLDIYSDGGADEKEDKSECSSRYDISGGVLASKASKESDLNGQLTGFLPVVASVVRPRPVPTSAPDTPQDPYFKNSTTLFHLMHHQQPPAGDYQGTVKKALSEQEALVVLSSIENILHLIKDLFEAIVPQLPQRLQPSAARTLDAFKSLGPAMQLVTSLTAATHTASDGQPHAAFNGNAELSRYTLETSQMGVMPVCGGERTEVPKNIYMQPTSVQTEKNPVEIERIVSEELQPQPLAYAHDLETNVGNGESNPLVLLSQKLFGCRPEDLPPNLLPDLCQTLAMAPHLLRE